MTIPFPCLKFMDESSWIETSLNFSARLGCPLRPAFLHVLYHSLPPGALKSRSLRWCFSNMSLSLCPCRARPKTHPSGLSQMARLLGRLCAVISLSFIATSDAALVPCCEQELGGEQRSLSANTSQTEDLENPLILGKRKRMDGPTKHTGEESNTASHDFPQNTIIIALKGLQKTQKGSKHNL